MGRPTSRSESAVTVRLVQEIAAAVSDAFLAVNHITDPEARQEAFAARLVELGQRYDPNNGGV